MSNEYIGQRYIHVCVCGLLYCSTHVGVCACQWKWLNVHLVYVTWGMWISWQRSWEVTTGKASHETNHLMYILAIASAKLYIARELVLTFMLTWKHSTLCTNVQMSPQTPHTAAHYAMNTEYLCLFTSPLLPGRVGPAGSLPLHLRCTWALQTCRISSSTCLLPWSWQANIRLGLGIL